jgi:hypothetical protein
MEGEFFRHTFSKEWYLTLVERTENNITSDTSIQKV